MKLLEISPFIRYAFRMTFLPKTDTYTSLDCRLFYIHNGEGSIEIEGITHHFHNATGTLLLWQPNTRYRFICDTPIDVTTINFDYTDERSEIIKYFDPILLKSHNADIANKDNIDFEDCPSLNTPIVLHNASSVIPYLETVVAEHALKQPFHNAKISGALKSCIADVVRMNAAPSLTSMATKKLDIVIQYIHENYQDSISNSLLASLVSYHPYYLNRLMLSTKGVTLHQYIINYRLTIAEKLLLTTDESISTIALKTGFSNITCFTTNFKKKNHMTPSDFREKLAE